MQYSIAVLTRQKGTTREALDGATGLEPNVSIWPTQPDLILNLIDPNWQNLATVDPTWLEYTDHDPPWYSFWRQRWITLHDNATSVLCGVHFTDLHLPKYQPFNCMVAPIHIFSNPIQGHKYFIHIGPSELRALPYFWDSVLLIASWIFFRSHSLLNLPCHILFSQKGLS